MSRRIIICERCKVERRHHCQGLCHACYRHQLCHKIINGLEKTIRPASSYNRQIFSLYLTYTRRLKQLTCVTWRQARDLAKLLEDEPMEPITDWSIVHDLSRRHRLAYQANRGRKNCAFIRIGRMLEEIGVLSSAQEDRCVQIKKHLSAFSIRTRPIMEIYLAHLAGRRVVPKSQVYHLVALKQVEQFLKDRDANFSLLELSIPLFRDYLHFRTFRIPNPATFQMSFYQIRRFYRWAVYKKYIAFDPTAGSELSKSQRHLSICSDGQVKKLIRYVRKKETNPRLAMLVILPLLFGLTAEELRFARLEIIDNRFRIHFRKRPVARVYRGRRPFIDLPNTPAWLLELQKRFYADWLIRLKETRVDQPVPWLFPAGNQRSVVACNTSLLLKLIGRATTAATGINIPFRVLQKTCGHMFTRQSDGSLLTRIGWASSTAFTYTWCPREYFSRPAKSART